MRPVRFDESLPLLVNLVVDVLGPIELAAGTVLRDVVGALAYFASTPLSDADYERLDSELHRGLGRYARPDRVLVRSTDFGADAVREDPTAIFVDVDGRRVRLVDRRIAGADWLRAPRRGDLPRPPRIVFASLKGGVGRSTALTVSAVHLAAGGRRVLAVDLDMEAPGLGALLLSADELPEFGMIDALVEDGISGLDDIFLADLVAPTALAGNSGRIDVIPALGRRSLENPADVLGKLSRAYAEDVRQDGTVASILDQVRSVIDAVASPERYDVVLVDARAGLHETTASAVLGLGAEVLLFGLNEDQTFQGYRLMLSHLARLVDPQDPHPEWVDRLTMVEGKMPEGEEDAGSFAERCQELFREAGFGAEQTTDDIPSGATDAGAVEFRDVVWDDDVADDIVLGNAWTIPDPVTILFDPRFHRFNPARRPNLLSEPAYRVPFGDLLDRIERIVQAAEESP